MHKIELKKALEGVFDEHEDRRYLGMSQISKCPLYLYRMMVDGQERPAPQSLRYFHEGYLHEADILARMEKAGVPVEGVQRELVAPWDDRLRGHIDCELDGDLVEIKSVDSDRFNSVVDRGAFFDHMDQCQMYMRYGGYEEALIVYKNRETGELYIYAMHRSEEIGERLERKARAVLEAVDAGEPPECTCGRCG